VRVVVLVLMALALAACDPLSSFAEVQSQSARAGEALEREFGSKPQIAWKVHNGSLAYVAVTYELGAVKSVAAGELSERTRAIILKHFEDQPRHLTVGVSVSE
jgi:hypothetical protein